MKKLSLLFTVLLFSISAFCLPGGPTPNFPQWKALGYDSTWIQALKARFRQDVAIPYGNLAIGDSFCVPSSLFSVNSTTKGMLPPRMSTSQRTAISSPAKGLMVYDITLNALFTYNGTGWIQAAQSSGTATQILYYNSSGTLTGDANFIRAGIPTLIQRVIRTEITNKPVTQGFRMDTASFETSSGVFSVCNYAIIFHSDSVKKRNYVVGVIEIPIAGNDTVLIGVSNFTNDILKTQNTISIDDYTINGTATFRNDETAGFSLDCANSRTATLGVSDTSDNTSYFQCQLGQAFSYSKDSAGNHCGVSVHPTAVDYHHNGTTIILPSADGTAGQAMITDGSGGLSFGTVTNDIFGYAVGYTTPLLGDVGTIAFGEGVPDRDTAQGGFNVFIGYKCAADFAKKKSSVADNTSNNIVIGSESCTGVDSFSHSVVVGTYATISNSNNHAVGIGDHVKIEADSVTAIGVYSEGDGISATALGAHAHAHAHAIALGNCTAIAGTFGIPTSIDSLKFPLTGGATDKVLLYGASGFANWQYLRHITDSLYTTAGAHRMSFYNQSNTGTWHLSGNADTIALGDNCVLIAPNGKSYFDKDAKFLQNVTVIGNLTASVGGDGSGTVANMTITKINNTDAATYISNVVSYAAVNDTTVTITDSGSFTIPLSVTGVILKGFLTAGAYTLVLPTPTTDKKIDILTNGTALVTLLSFSAGIGGLSPLLSTGFAVTGTTQRTIHFDVTSNSWY